MRRYLSYSPIIVLTNYNSFQLTDSLPRKIVTEKMCVKKLKLKKWKAQSGSLLASSSFKTAYIVKEVKDEGDPSPQDQSYKVCHIHYCSITVSKLTKSPII